MKYLGKLFFLKYPLLKKLYESRMEFRFTLSIDTFVGISDKQVGSYYEKIPTSNNKVGYFLLTNVGSSFGVRLYDLTFTFEGYVDEVTVEDCTFKEFVELYGELYISGKFSYTREEMIAHAISIR